MEKLIQLEQVLQIGAKLLQIRAAPVVTNRGSSSYYKSGQNYYKLGQLLQIGKNYYKSGHVLQIGAVITNRCKTHSLQSIRLSFILILINDQIELYLCISNSL